MAHFELDRKAVAVVKKVPRRLPLLVVYTPFLFLLLHMTRVVHSDVIFVAKPVSSIILELSYVPNENALSVSLTNKGPDDTLVSLGEMVGYRYFASAVQVMIVDRKGH